MVIILLDNPKDRIAVWRATEIHLMYLYESKQKIDIIIPSLYINDLKLCWSNSFKPDNIITFKNKLHLALLLHKYKNDNFFCITAKEVLLVKFLNPLYKNTIYYWVQGLVTEEDFLRTKSKLRKFYISKAEKIALKLANKHILVSDFMLKYIEKTRNITIKKYIIIPCTSDLKMQDCEKIKDSFVYIGGVSAWQKIDTMLQLYTLLVKKNKKRSLYILTQNTDKMQIIVNKIIPIEFQENVEIHSLFDRFEIAKFLSRMEYGFLIRDDDPINNVSSPIKLAEYLSCGVNVIMSKSVSSYTNFIQDFNCGIIIEKENDIYKIENLECNKDNAILLYNKIFNYKKMIIRYKHLINN